MESNALQTITQNFLIELTDANQEKKTSLPFLKNFIPTPFVKDDEIFQVLVVGGSICRNVLMKRSGSEFTILSHIEKDQPIFHTKEDFLAFVSLELDKTVTNIALNFAFPVQPTKRENKLDGKLLYGTKEHTFAGMQGKNVGETIEAHILATQQRTIDICVANDTICLLLSGMINHTWNELACAIVGTGYNAAMFLSSQEAVNLESGGFSNIPQDNIAQAIDNTSSQPGMQLFEKQTSGGYLYRVFNETIKQKGLSYPEIPSTKSLDDLARGNSKVGMYAKEILQTSAALVACQIAGMAAYSKKDLVVIVEGSLFWKGYQYKETVEKTLKEISDYKITFTHVPNSSVMGAAKLIA